MSGKYHIPWSKNGLVCRLTFRRRIVSIYITLITCASIEKTHGCVRKGSETHETVLLDCTTGVQSNNTSRMRFTVISHTPMRSRFYHTLIMYKRNWDGSCLVNSIYFALHNFQIHNLLHCIDASRWNMSFKEMRLDDSVVGDAVAMLLPLWLHAAALWRHAVWVRIVTSHIAWMGYAYSLPNLNRPRAIHKHDPHPLETMGRVW